MQFRMAACWFSIPSFGSKRWRILRHNLMIPPTLSFNWLVRLLPIATAHTIPGCSHSGHYSPDARLHLQLRHYFMTEPMPGCMRQAMRIYVDGLEPLKRSGDRDKDLQDSMRNLATTVNRFANAMRTAMPLWALEAQGATSMPRCPVISWWCPRFCPMIRSRNTDRR